MLKKLYWLLLIIIILAGCNSQTKQVQNFDIPNYNASFELNEQNYSMKPGSYSWTKKKFMESYSVTTDYAHPYEQAREIESTILPAGEKVIIDVDEKPTIKMVEWENEKSFNEIAIRKGEFTLPSAPGVYIYEVIASWKQGYRSYIIKIEIK